MSDQKEVGFFEGSWNLIKWIASFLPAILIGLLIWDHTVFFLTFYASPLLIAIALFCYMMQYFTDNSKE